jgi:crossover junction endodeoxyribonuclease RusA
MFLEVTVPGVPVPQGSMRHVGGGRLIHSNRDLPAWRAQVSAHTIAAIVRSERQTPHRWPATGPVRLHVVFTFPRPKNHYRTGKYANLLRKVAPRYMQTGPDLDKLIRAIGDALVGACAIVDDKQICHITASKTWTPPDLAPAAYIHLRGD